MSLDNKDTVTETRLGGAYASVNLSAAAAQAKLLVQQREEARERAAKGEMPLSPAPVVVPQVPHGTDNLDIQTKATDIALDPNTVVNLNPHRIRGWVFADRPENEFGDISELLQSIRITTQLQPIVVRPVQGDPNHDYEYLVGARRVAACRLGDIEVQAVIRTVDDREAYRWMVDENEKRKSLSPWAQALSYKKAIDDGLYKNDTDLASELGKSRQTISDLFAYFRIDRRLYNAIGCLSNVGTKTARAIITLQGQRPELMPTLIEMAEGLRDGNMGPAQVKALLSTPTNPAPRPTPAAPWRMQASAKGVAQIEVHLRHIPGLTAEKLNEELEALFTRYRDATSA